MKILILKPSSLGDVVQALPVLRLLKLHAPDSQIFWWLAAELRPLLEGDPDLTDLFLFQRRGWTSPFYWVRLLNGLRQMRRLSFDWVIDLQSLARSAVIAWLSRGSMTIGLEDPREGAEAFYDLHVPRPSYLTHAVDWYLEVLKALHVPADRPFDWLPKRAAVAADVRRKWPVAKASWLVIHPGARWPNKRWPIEHYSQTVKILAQAEPAWRFAILGAQSDWNLGQQIAEAAPHRCLNLTGKTSLPEMVEWIRLSELMITNDTGPMHVAAALKKPVVALFGPTEPHRTGPYGQVNRAMRVHLPCVPCMLPVCNHHIPLECLLSITPEQAAAEVKSRMEEKVSHGPARIP